MGAVGEVSGICRTGSWKACHAEEQEASLCAWEDSGLLPGPGPGKVESCLAIEAETQYRRLGQGGYLVGRPKGLGWGLQGGLGPS